MGGVESTTEQEGLTATVTLDHALAIADAEGLKAVTIRRLARELGVTPMALYWHFKSKDELLDALADRLVGEIDLAVDNSIAWHRQLEVLLTSMVTVLRAHPSAAALVGVRNNTSAAALRATEVALEILHRGGFRPAEAVNIARQAIRTVAALVSAQPGFAPTMSASEVEEMRDRTLELLGSLPLEHFPRVVAAAGPLATCDDPSAYYNLGLEIVLAGIRAAATHRASRSD